MCANLILEGGQPLRFLGRVHVQGREYLDAENLFVPLANDNGEPTFILGQCRYTPRRSETEDIWENQMASLPGRPSLDDRVWPNAVRGRSA